MTHQPRTPALHLRRTLVQQIYYVNLFCFFFDENESGKGWFGTRTKESWITAAIRRQAEWTHRQGRA
jgi:hypothetical protein